MTAVKTSESHCPMCRGPISRMERCAPQRATDVDNDMKKFSGNCKCCGKQVKFSRMRLHYQCCYEYQKEYGCKPKNPYPSFFPPLTGYRAHSMFQCPVCQENGFDRKSLVEHCNSQHSTQIIAKVCPICASLPWGDPTYVSSNLVGHLNARHKFIYEGEYAMLGQGAILKIQEACQPIGPPVNQFLYLHLLVDVCYPTSLWIHLLRLKERKLTGKNIIFPSLSSPYAHYLNG
nr:E3 ubiquitin-protein ligase RNF138-like isoform X2 [Geotrypetes seraphini]